MSTAQTQAQEAFAARMAEKHITPLWTIANRVVMREPTPKIPPVFWSYQRDVRPYILEAAEVISAAEAHRRVLVLNNPTLKHGATHTLTCAIQLIKGGEVAPAHRHSQAALRFVIEGERRLHRRQRRAHLHASGRLHRDAGLDLARPRQGNRRRDDLARRARRAAGQSSRRDLLRGIRGEAIFPQSRPPHDSLSRYGSGMLPLEPITQRHSPVFCYPYERTRTALENMRKANDWDACHGLKLKFANPATGDWVMPTIATFAQLLPKGFKTAPYRSTEATIVMAAEGSGTATVGDQTYTLQKNDIFVAPNWTWWQVEAKDDLVLLSYSDRAALEKLDLWREQRANEPLKL